MSTRLCKPAVALTALPVCLLAAAVSMPAFADAMSPDYDALERLFGEPITASATGSPQRESEVAATMVIVTAEDIRRSGARDIPGVLRHIGGLDVLFTSNDHSDVSIRGYNTAYSSRLLVLVDGRQVYADYYGFTPWSTVPVELSAIRRIEVVKGPNSALFGFNAVGGVINIITYDPVRDDVDAVSVSGGTQSLAQASLVSTWHSGESAGLRLTAGYRNDDDFSSALLPSEVGVRRGNERSAISLSGGRNVSDRVRVGLDASYSDVRQAEFPPIYTLTYDDYETSSIGGHLVADTGVGLVQASVYTNHITSDLYEGGAEVPFSEFENRATVAKLQGISKIGGDILRLSTEYRRNSMGTTPIDGGNVSYTVLAFGGMWQTVVSSKVTLTGAVRVDRWSLARSGTVPAGYGLGNEDWDRTATEPSFNAAVVWHPGEDDTVRFLAGRGVQLPNLVNLGGFVLPFPPVGYVGGVPDLEPTVVHNYEVSWDRNLPHPAAKLRVSAFVGRTRDIVAAAGVPRLADGLASVAFNAGGSDTAGIEASIGGTLRDEWRWRVSYLYQDIDDALDPPLPAEVTYTDFEDTTSKHVVKASGGWERGRWTVDGFVLYRSKFSGIRADALFSQVVQLVPVPGYTVIDGRVGYRPTDNIELSLSGRNLTGTERQSAAPEVERAFYATMSVDFGRRE